MPVRVDVPIRIRVDPGALARRSCCIESALSAAVGRALRKSADIVLAARGGYVGVQIHPPEFRWCGDGLGQVPQGLRLNTQQLVASVLGEGAKALGKSERSDGADVPESASVQEALDPARVDEGLGIYLVPSYDGRRRTAIEVKKKRAAEPQRYGWRNYSGLEEVLGRADFDELIDQAVSRWGVVAGPEDRGFIWREGKSLGFVIFKAGAGQVEIAHHGAIGGTPRVQARRQERRLDQSALIVAASSWQDHDSIRGSRAAGSLGARAAGRNAVQGLDRRTRQGRAGEEQDARSR